MKYSFPLYILLTGSIIVLSVFSRFGLEKLGVPVLIGYFILGFAFRILDLKWSFLEETGYQIPEFLANVGIIVLLFHVGMENRLERLIKWLSKAVTIRFSDTFLYGFPGFLVSSYLSNKALSQVCSYQPLPLRPLLKRKMINHIKP